MYFFVNLDLVVLTAYRYIVFLHISIRCRPSKVRRCIPDVVLKNEGSMVQIKKLVET